MSHKTAEAPPKRKTATLLAPWIVVVGLLAIPFIAMRFTSEVDWTALDFGIMGAMLASVIGVWQFATRSRPERSYRFGLGLLLLGSFLLLWSNLAVGIVGNEANPVNLLFHLVLAAGIFGTVGARFTPRGMVATSFAMAFVQAAIGAGLLVTGEAVILPLTAVFCAFWLGAARLFQLADANASDRLRCR